MILDFNKIEEKALANFKGGEKALNAKMNVDENPNTARQFGLMSIPTLLFKKDGQVVKQVAGVHTKDHIKAILAEIG